jgi:hypothetical protein
MTLPIMVDGIAPDVPAIHARYPNNPVACYADGGYAWSPAQEALFARKIRISVEAGLPEGSAHARCIDVERGAATPADARPFLEAHRALGFTNGTVYCSASNVRTVLDAAGDCDVPRWWIAWWTGRPQTPAEVVAEVRAQCGVDLPESKVWAQQYANFPEYDLSVVFGKPDFSHR